MSSPPTSQNTKIVSGAALAALLITGITLTVIYTAPSSNTSNIQITDQDREITPSPQQEDYTPAPEPTTSFPWSDEDYTPEEEEEEEEIDYQVSNELTFNTFSGTSVCIFHEKTYVFTPDYIQCVVDESMVAHEITSGYSAFSGRNAAVDLYAGLIDGDCSDYIKTITCR